MPLLPGVSHDRRRRGLPGIWAVKCTLEKSSQNGPCSQI
jgi:hypothetical protein